MPWIDQRGDTHPSISDIVDWERDALHFICCPSCQRTMPWAWAIIRGIEAQTLPI